MKIKKLIDKYFDPLLYVDIRLPFFEIRTTLMHANTISNEYSYMRFKVQIFKWNIGFNLYDTEYRRRQRYSKYAEKNKNK